MKRGNFVLAAFCVLLCLGLAGIVWANGALDGDEPAIMASPSTIVLSKVSTVTIHTNIPYSVVASDEDGKKIVNLNGVAPISVWYDTCGHLAARFSVAALALQPDKANLTLSGSYVEGGGFEAAVVVKVK
ncbi:MAG: hypothetical protein GX594_05165 [Pirellulaceae bacterium]|nr:hypothetical protein [Pirellulaceae bacterium]